RTSVTSAVVRPSPARLARTIPPCDGEPVSTTTTRFSVRNRFTLLHPKPPWKALLIGNPWARGWASYMQILLRVLDGSVRGPRKPASGFVQAGEGSVNHAPRLTRGLRC